MKHTVREICGLLRLERPELQSAAALVLGELRVADAAVVRQLGELLQNGKNPLLKGYVLEALSKIGSREAVPYVLPLLAAESELREQAIRVLAGFGPGMALELKNLRKTAATSERRAIHRVLARVRGPSGTRLLLESLTDEDAETVEDALAAIRAEVRALTPRERKSLLDAIRRFLKRPDVKANPATLSAALRALGSLEDPGAQPVLLSYVGVRSPAPVRAAALSALRATPRPKGSQDALVRKLLLCLADKDFEHVVGPVLDILYPVKMTSRLGSALEPLTRSPHAAVKKFALHKLREVDSSSTVELLLRFLDDPDPSVAELAAESLMSVPAARGVLTSRLMRVTDVEGAWRLARILRPHGERFTREQQKSLGDRMVRLLDQGSRLFEPLLFLLRHSTPQQVRAALLQRGLRKKRSRHFDEAARSFRLLEQHDLIDAQGRYELAVALLKLQGKGGPVERGPDDPVVRLLVAVAADPAFPAFERMRKDTVLGAEDLLALGRALVGGSGAERSLGGQLLHLVIRKAPRSKLAREAKEQLQHANIR